jgi:membrane-bound inhibitor of C-type lysozyme
MIVFPQSFNYRLIIGTLVIALAILGSYSISSFNAFEDQEEFLEQETKLVQNELSEMISLYDDVAVENESIKSQLEQSKTKMINILDSVKKVKANLSLISSYRSKIYTLKNEREVIFDQIDSLVRNNKTLKVQVDSVAQQFENQRLQLAYLTEKNNSLYEIVSKVSLLKAKNIKAASLKTSSSLVVYETSKLSETDHIEVCTTLSSNEFTPKGNKNIYVQILDPNNEVVSERGILKFQGMNLEYSGKTTIKSITENITACLKISIEEKEKLIAGTYNINVFQNATLLGNTTLELK